MQWRKKADEGEVRRLTWVCGSERVWVEDVVDHVRSAVGASAVDYGSYSAGVDADREIWAGVNQYSIDPGAPRLVVVRDAERVRDWGPFLEWCQHSREMPTTHIVFVSGEEDFPYSPGPEGKRGKGVLRGHVVKVKERGRLVRCGPGSRDDLRWWIRRTVGGSDLVVDYFIDRAGGSVPVIADALKKMELFSGELSREAVDLLCRRSSEDSFVADVIRGDTVGAVGALAVLPEGGYGRTVGRLNAMLTHLGRLNVAVRSRETVVDVIKGGEVPVAVAREFYPVAQHYSEERRSRCREVLGLTDQALMQGQRVGVMEALVALW